MKAIYIDTEVNSLECLEPIEVAWAEAREGFGLGDLTCQRYKPHSPIDPSAAAVHLIVPDDLRGEKDCSEVDYPEAEYWIAHNIDFDWKVLGSPEVKRICTLACARKLWPGLSSHKLGAIYLHLNEMTPESRDLVAGAHNASVDVKILSRVTQAIAAEAKAASPQELYEFSEIARIPEVMPFGKHKGQPLKEVPADYVGWLLRQDLDDQYLRKALVCVQQSRN